MIIRIAVPKTINMLFIFLLVILFDQMAFAGPWFTGPLLAPAGHTIPKGHTNVEIYGLDVLTDGNYTTFGTLIHKPRFRSFVVNPIITHGFTDWLDVQLITPYVFNATQGEQDRRLADVAASLGIQLIEQNQSPKRADVRILIQETFPTGRYEHLRSKKLGTDSTGLGSYQTQFGLNLQYLLPVFQTHYLRTRLILSRLYASQVNVSGVSSYGGTAATLGKIKPGVENGIDLAFEYTVTQNWVAVLEGTMSNGQATRFNGILNIGTIGGPSSTIGASQYQVKALAPALEYNFSGNLGLIGGVWFPVAGKNTSHFTTYVLALNTYW
jgi:hypothetical protein